MSEFENEQMPAETAPAEVVEEAAAVEAPVEAAVAPAAEPEPAPVAEAANEAGGATPPPPASGGAESNRGENARPPRKEGEGKPRGERPARMEKGERQDRGQKGDKPKNSDRREGGEKREGGERRDDRGPRRDARPAGGREHGRPAGRPDLMVDIDIEKLMADSLYLDNQAHAVVSRIREMDTGTRSQVRRLFSAVRRACRAAEADRQHQFVMLRARLAYTIARHQLRSLDPLERLLLQVTRKNDPRAYERFRDLFEAIVAYNE